MSRSKTAARPSSRARKRSFAESAEFPRGILALVILLVGFVLLVAALSDAAGKLARPGIGTYFYIAALIAIVAIVGFVDRKKSLAVMQLISGFLRKSLFSRKTIRIA